MADKLLITEYIHTNQHTCYQKYTSLCNKYSISPKTLHSHGRLSNKMSLPKRTHKYTISDQSNNS